MKKYKVLTGNLDWIGFQKNEIINYPETDDEWKKGRFSDEYLYLANALQSHPDWFEEVKEEPLKKEFTRDDVVELMRDTVSSCCVHPKTFDDVQGYFNSFLRNRGFDDIMYKNTKYFIKAKRFTKEDMIEFGELIDRAHAFGYKQKEVEDLFNNWLNSKEKH